ncbi:cell division protein FtsL [Desertibaculum subflavum]|uniref:cell division protein FtsL n=1 Tax=Desertibaculum subflavum TaxID=2268458 RepID=UPI0013C3F42C
MKRVVPLVGILFFGCVAFGMYHLAYEVKRLEDELIAYNRALLREREAIDFLQAEWSYLSRPDRLQASAARHLQLEATPLHRLQRIEDLPARPVGAMADGWGVIVVPDPNAPPLPLAKPAPESAPVPAVPNIAVPTVERDRTSRSVALHGDPR